MPAKLRTDNIADAITPLATRMARDPEIREHAMAVLDSAKTVIEKVQREGARSAANAATRSDDDAR